jgi:7-cyano-7-deazaguanine synthase
MNKALLIISGGLDSVVLAYKMAHDGISFDAIFADFGKFSTQNELQYARFHTLQLNGNFDVIDISKLSRSFIGHVTSNAVTLDELDRAGDTHIMSIPNQKRSVVQPSGFPILLSIATYFANISGKQQIYTGIIKEQTRAVSTTPKFFHDWGRTISLLNSSAWPIEIKTPLISSSKAEVIKLGNSLGVPFEMTWSCIRATEIHCGVCPRCTERRKGFLAAGVADPTQYLS